MSLYDSLWTSYSTKKTLLIEVQELPLNGHNNYIALVFYAVSRISALVLVHFFFCAVYDKAFLVLCQNYCVLGEFRILWQLLFQTIHSSGASYIVLGKSGLFPIKQILNWKLHWRKTLPPKWLKSPVWPVSLRNCLHLHILLISIELLKYLE